jgi:hypothetical protein
VYRTPPEPSQRDGRTWPWVASNHARQAPSSDATHGFPKIRVAPGNGARSAPLLRPRVPVEYEYEHEDEDEDEYEYEYEYEHEHEDEDE